jgi:arginyl-tRNA synthetase
MSLYEKIKENISKKLEQALVQARLDGELSFDKIPSFVLEEPRERQHGDLATNLAFLLSKEAQKPPREIAAILVDKLDKEGIWLSACEIAGPGFINFRLDPQWLVGVIPEILNQKDRYGAVDIGKGEKVQVEFVSANPTGLLHMGNARGAALGDSLASILDLAGYQVTREYYINDAGNQIYNFALSLEARYLQQLGLEAPLPEDGYQGPDLIETAKRFVALHGDKYQFLPAETRRQALVEFGLEEKISTIRKTLADFGVNYDVWFSEQTLHTSGQIEETVQKLDKQGYVYEKDGALWLKTTLFGDEKDEVLIRKNGVPTYFAADIAYHRHKYERGFDRVINIWGADHHGHVARMKGAMQALGYQKDSLQIILMQLVRLISGGEIARMSKRSGQYITLQELIAEVGKDAARFFFLLRDPDSTVEFDLDLAKSQSADNPVYYVQYAHARLCSIIRQAKEQGFIISSLPTPEQLSLLSTLEERDLLKKMADFPGEIALAAQMLEPHRLARYVLDFASLFHTFYNSQRVLVDDEDLRTARLALIYSARQVLANALKVLGVSAPERM